jgi:hypothetical protein
MTAAPSPKPGQLISVIVGQTCKGFLFRRRDEFEAFTADQVSVGTFGSEREAIAAILTNPTRQIGAPVGVFNPRSVDEKAVAEHKWQSPTLAPKPQAPCDIGLFSDDSKQKELFLDTAATG